jgi:beta-galactosidase
MKLMLPPFSRPPLWLQPFFGAALVAVCLLSMPRSGACATFAIGDNDFLLDGKPFLIRCGEMHFARVPREYWKHRLRMARAMGLNTVCAYLFWNVHEPQPGKFDFSGNAGAAEFCRIAQQEGLKVILRPGPYACAEWDFGGFPYWLLKLQDLKLRSQDPRYLAACQRYLKAVGRQLAPLQITRGGPIILVQVENEYGSYGRDRQYLHILRDTLKEAGFDVPFFTCDPAGDVPQDACEDIFCAANFGSDPAANFQKLRKVRPAGPLICAEYYPGWFDSWGQPHHFGETERIIKDITWMLEHNASFSIYMAHGGTTFGLDSGANCPPYTPEITSYDYDAPISEAGWDTPKFHALRQLFQQHLEPGETLPDIPARNPVVNVDAIELREVAPLFDNLPAATKTERPQPMEMYDQAHGCILYRARLAAGAAATLKLTDLHDYALVFLDGRKIATLDRRHDQNSAPLAARFSAASLDILVEAMGRVNFGKQMFDPKGITRKVELVSEAGASEVTGWEVFNLPLDGAELASLKYRTGPADGSAQEAARTGGPAFYRGAFELNRPADTFLDVRQWGKGVVWVNGRNLGRFWNIGPQQTLYCPGPWLHAGRNQVVILELNGAQKHVIAGLAEPILNEVKTGE